MKPAYFLLFAATFIAGCGHPAHLIAISPDISSIERDHSAREIPKNVAYYLKDDREKEVTTPAGGFDKVKYKPYKDIDAGFHKILSNVFQRVSVLGSDQDIASAKDDYIISLAVSTDSYSSSISTWPPTEFSVNLNCDIKDEAGRNITSLVAAGEGHADTKEFHSDFSLAGRRAAQEALMKMQQALLNAPELAAVDAKTPSPQPTTSNEPTQATPDEEHQHVAPVEIITADLPRNDPQVTIYTLPKNDSPVISYPLPAAASEAPREIHAESQQAAPDIPATVATPVNKPTALPGYCISANSTIADAARLMRDLFGKRKSGLISAEEFQKMSTQIIYGKLPSVNCPSNSRPS